MIGSPKKPSIGTELYVSGLNASVSYDFTRRLSNFLVYFSLSTIKSERVKYSEYSLSFRLMETFFEPYLHLTTQTLTRRKMIQPWKPPGHTYRSATLKLAFIAFWSYKWRFLIFLDCYKLVVFIGK